RVLYRAQVGESDRGLAGSLDRHGFLLSGSKDVLAERSLSGDYRTRTKYRAERSDKSESIHAGPPSVINYLSRAVRRGSRRLVLLELDIRRLDDPGPPRHIRLHQCGELLRRRRERLHSLPVQEFPRIRQRDDPADFNGEPVDDRLRRAGRRKHAEPRTHLQARQAALGEGGNLRQRRYAGFAGDGNRSDPAALDM